jgi:hypothetical protein
MPVNAATENSFLVAFSAAIPLLHDCVHSSIPFSIATTDIFVHENY